MEKQKRIYKSIITFLCLLLSVCAFTGTIDKKGENDTDKSLSRALVAFGIARGINGVISVAQGTELSLQPMGIGLNFAPGEILDPVNDLVERFSLIMLASSSAIGIQKILLEISKWPALTFFLACACVLFLLLFWSTHDIAIKYRHIAFRVMLIMTMLRFSIPVYAAVNEWVFNRFLSDQFNESYERLEYSKDAIKKLNETTENEAAEKNPDRSITGQIKQLYTSSPSYADLKEMIENYKEAAADTVKHMIDLIVIFIFQTILFPVVFLFILYSGLKYLIFSYPKKAYSKAP